MNLKQWTLVHCRTVGVIRPSNLAAGLSRCECKNIFVPVFCLILIASCLQRVVLRHFVSCLLPLRCVILGTCKTNSNEFRYMKSHRKRIIPTYFYGVLLVVYLLSYG